MNILVTGAAGFVGSNICHGLLKSNDRVFGIDNFSFGCKENVPYNTNNFNFIIGDFDLCTEEFLNGFDVLVHCATSNIIYSQTNSIETFRNNAINTIKLFQKFGGKIIYTSTASVYNNASLLPTPETAATKTYNSYDSSKLISELFLERRKNYTTLRLSNVYGINQRYDNPYCGAIGKMIHSVLADRSIQINGSGKDTRDFTFVDDVVDAVIRSVKSPALNDTINIATQTETSSIELSKTICKILGKPHDINFVSPRSIDTIKRRCLDVSKAKELLGWSPRTSLKDGLKKTIRWQQHENKR